MAAERGRDWWAVAVGLVIVALVSGVLWEWLDGTILAPSVVTGISPEALVAIVASVILLIVLFTRLRHR